MSATMSSDKQINPMEQFVLLAKTARGAAAVELIRKALEAPNMYVFGELLDMPHIQELNTGTTQPHYNLLNLFAYGTFQDYKAQEASLPQLTPVMIKKLRHLSIVSLATKNKCLPYSLLLKELHLRNLRELEDLIIKVIYADIVRGKLDQTDQQFEVDYAIGRDVRPEQISEICAVLQQWCSGCETVLTGIEQQVHKANNVREQQNAMKAEVETAVSNIKKTLQTSQQCDMDEQMVTESATATVQKPLKKSSKRKGLRGSTKLWGKFS